MPASPSPSAQGAREAVARRLRGLRRDAGLTITELGDRCGWHHAKTSRIENARTAPSAKDIRLWCSACGVPAQAQDIVVQSLNAESLYREWRDQVRAGLKQLQDGLVPLFRETTLFRVYSSTLVPGLLQTEGYAAAVLRSVARFRDLPFDDSAEAARARVERSRIIQEPGQRRFVLLMEESVLHYTIADADAMAAQLGHLLSVGALPAVSLGIIPVGVMERDKPRETFHVYDDRLVSVELISAEVTVTQPTEVALYVKAFEQLRAGVVYGAQARTLIVKAIESLH